MLTLLSFDGTFFYLLEIAEFCCCFPYTWYISHFYDGIAIFFSQKDLTGTENLEEVEELEMRVDTRDTSLGNFGVHLPNLKQLKLTNSIITTVRQIYFMKFRNRNRKSLDIIGTRHTMPIYYCMLHPELSRSHI